MRLLIFVNKFDENDDLLGFFMGWVSRLSQNFEKIIIIAQSVGKYPKQKNVTVCSLNKEQTKCWFSRLVKFYKYLWQFRDDYDIVFIFMAPSWVVGAWLPVKLLGKKLTFWYAVWKDSLKLRLATFFSDKVVSSISRAFPFQTKKLILVGQGIDVSYFKPDESVRESNRLLFLGRISPIKNLEILIGALGKIKNLSPQIYDKIRVEIIGAPASEKDSNYLTEMKKFAVVVGIDKKLEWLGKISHRYILPYYQKAGIFINLTPTGSFDKTMLEAMACGDLLLASNEALREFFSEPFRELFLFKQGNVDELARKLTRLLSIEPDQLSDKARNELRGIVVKNHSQEDVVNNLTKFFKSLV